MEQKQPRSLTGDTLKIYWHHAIAYWPMLLLCATGILTLIVCDLVSPIIYKKFFDMLALDPIHRTNPATLHQVYNTIGLITLFGFISWTGWRVCMYAVSKFESQVMADLSNTCFEYIHNHSYRFFADNFAGSLVKRVNRFSSGFEVIADQCTLHLGQIVIRVILIIGILFWRNTTLGFVFLAWTIVFTIFHVLFSKYKLTFDLKKAELDTRVTGRLSDTISNNINLKLFAGIEREVTNFKSLTNEHRLARYKSWIIGEWSSSIQGFSVRILEIVVLIMAIRYWIEGTLTLGDFIMLRSYLYQLTDRVQEVGHSVRRIYESMADANEMTEILLMPHEICDTPRAKKLSPTYGEVTFSNVTFSYPGNTNTILKSFNLSTKHGERIGIVGSSGGGKSTILKLLVRMYDVTSGCITIDGQNIKHVTQSSLHKNIAYVPQDPILFHRTILENIRYSCPGATDEEVMEASKKAHCHEFISKFPLGYKTFVGERGIKLSGGERQRVAIARAFLMNAPIIVLDEATSSLDSESESFIQESLAELMNGKTVIAVAHRLSTIRKMDRIIVIKDGEIIEEGNHELLLTIENGVYQKLWDLQSNDPDDVISEGHAHTEQLQ